MANNREDRKFYFFETDYEELKDMTPEQRAEYVMLMCRYFFDGIDTNPDDIQDKDIRKPWRYRRQSLKSSLKNIKDYERKKAKNAEIEPNKDFEEEKPVDVPQEPEKPVEKPESDYTDTSNYQEKTWDIYENNIDAFKTLYVKFKEHPDNTERKEAQNELRNILELYYYDDDTEKALVKTEINKLLIEWYYKNYQQTA